MTATLTLDAPQIEGRISEALEAVETRLLVVVSSAERTSNGAAGFRFVVGGVPSAFRGGACGIGAKPEGWGTAPGVSALYGAATGRGSATGVAKPSGRSMGAYAAPSVQVAMRPRIVGEPVPAEAA